MSEEYFAEPRWDGRTEELLRSELGEQVWALIHDPEKDVTEILIRHDWGSVERLSSGFGRIDALEKTCNVIGVMRLLAPFCGIRLGHQDAIVEIGLPMIGDGIRVAGSYSGPSGMFSFLTIRIGRVKPIPIDLLFGGTVREDFRETLKELVVRPDFGLLVAGGIGSGKTTALRSIQQHIIDTTGADEHFMVVEDSAELRLVGPQVTQMTSTRWTSTEATLRASLRHRVTRLVVGEIRGGEALDAIKAGALGAGLGMTIHANSAAGAIRTLKARMREGSPNGNIDANQIIDAVKMVLFVRRQRGNFVLAEAARPAAYNPATDEIRMESITL